MPRYATPVFVAFLLVCLTFTGSDSSFPGRKRNIFQNKAGPLSKNWQDPEYRLPGDIVPSTYSIRLLPFIEEGNFTIDGHVDIFVRCINDTNSITLNSLNITYDESSISVYDIEQNNFLNVAELIDEQDTRQMITIKTSDSLAAGKEYKISIPFISYLNDQLRGFYRSSYIEDGATKYLAITQMEPADARLAFPCFDEPSMKAKFSITLGRKESMTSTSNMPLLRSNVNQDDRSYYWDYYETSVEMSTYLVALMISEFKSTPTDESLSNVRFRILSRPEAANLTDYAGLVAPQILEFYESYFGIDYPLEKEDLAAIPDFRPGAMENWGFMTFQEDLLLVDEQSTPAKAKQLVAEVISHELAHQWFGDLVTMEWWNNIWLNEGFARYLQSLGVEAVEPNYKIQEQFVVDYLQPALAYDSSNSSHPMSSPEERSDIFDTIEYDKGGSVLRMCSYVLGKETFRRGLNRYLTRQAYGNAVEDDLWNILNEEAEIDGVVLPANLKDIMHSWTQEKNYPLITVHRKYGEQDGANVKQERFLLDDQGRFVSNEDDSYIWWVPLSYTHDFSSHATTVWLESKNKDLITVSATNDEWLIFNVEQSGFYRVAYDEQNYGLIAKQLVNDHEKISVINRAQLLDDAFALASAGVIGYTHAFNLAVYLANERDYVPWAAVADEVNYIDTTLYNQPQHADWKIFFTGLVKPAYEHYGFEESESDAHMTILTRAFASEWACHLEIADCVEHATAHYAALMSDPHLMLSPNMRSIILRTGVKQGETNEWDFAFKQYRETGDIEFLIAMTYTKQPNLIYGLLEEMIAPESSILKKDLDVMFQNLAANPLGNYLAVGFLTDRWDSIEQSIGPELLPSFFKYLCVPANTEAQENKLLALRDQHMEILGNAAEVEAGLALIEKNQLWLERNQEEIGNYLVNPATVPSTSPTQEITSPTEAPSSSEATRTSEHGSSSTISVSTTASTPTSTPSSSSGRTTQILILPLVLALAVLDLC